MKCPECKTEMQSLREYTGKDKYICLDCEQKFGELRNTIPNAIWTRNDEVAYFAGGDEPEEEEGQ